jgi:hypothetical protein
VNIDLDRKHIEIMCELVEEHLVDLAFKRIHPDDELYSEPYHILITLKEGLNETH